MSNTESQEQEGNNQEEITEGSPGRESQLNRKSMRGEREREPGKEERRECSPPLHSRLTKARGENDTSKVLLAKYNQSTQSAVKCPLYIIYNCVCHD